MTDSILLLKDFFEKNGIRFKENELLKRHTTFQIGGPCDFMVFPSTSKQIAAVITECRRLIIPLYFLGKGSDLLVSDDGLPGVVMQLGSSYSKIIVRGNELECEAGASLSAVCYAAYENGLTGLEFAWGIPGSAGGALFMNAGAYGGEIKDVISGAEHITDEGLTEKRSADQLCLSYRHSYYSEHPGCCISKLYFSLKPAPKEGIKAKMDVLMERRKSKQPLEFASAGSTFKRPPGHYAAALIEQCGLKGRSVGDAQVSEKHSGFLINRGNASCKDVEQLIQIVQEEVEKQTGCRLECEVRKLP